MFQAKFDVQRNAECVKSDGHEVADNEAKELDTRRDEVLMALCVVGSVSKQASTKPLVVLFDSGASHGGGTSSLFQKAQSLVVLNRPLLTH